MGPAETNPSRYPFLRAYPIAMRPADMLYFRPSFTP